MNIIHHHLIVQSEVKEHYGTEKQNDLKLFLLGLIDEIEMQCLIEPQ